MRGRRGSTAPAHTGDGRGRRAAALVLALGVALSGCGHTSDSELARQRADELVAKTQANGSAPGLTAETARNLYGEDAHSVCAPLRHDPIEVVTWARVTRHVPREQVRDLVAYDRAVVEVYCPDELQRYDELLDDLHVDEDDRSPTS